MSGIVNLKRQFETLIRGASKEASSVSILGEVNSDSNNIHQADWNAVEVQLAGYREPVVIKRNNLPLEEISQRLALAYPSTFRVISPVLLPDLDLT